ncbi:Chlorocatechol 1,2-dioxygenase [Falsiruegeria litorea R37]|uniref:Chlorocatechol 1,2-dioxygenase n=1 Tax=Falsiruegeria litorea R37 TaxID=1200284 RepID=A0A1Y5RTF9_9RHOB|nr:Chlorocatechol 1,2-dioxygenase [Falsiruegeria litorea R37]
MRNGFTAMSSRLAWRGALACTMGLTQVLFAPPLASESASADQTCVGKSLADLGFKDLVSAEDRLALEAKGLPKAVYTCFFTDPEMNETEHCGFTDETSSGPYFVANTPVALDGNINPTSEPGDPMQLTIRVFDGETGKPISGARIEPYTVDAKGEYYPYAPGFAEDFDDIRMRATLLADTVGVAVAHSIVPAPYENRRRHIHYYFSAPGYLPFFTQSYWADDPAAAGDPIDRNTEPCRTIEFIDIDGVSTGTFDVYMRPDTGTN